MLDKRRSEKKSFSFGISQLDDLINHENGIILFRTNSRRFAFEVGSTALLNNMEGGKREILLHFVDRNERYWTIDMNSILEKAREFGINEETIKRNIEIIKAFSPSQMDSEQNWDLIEDYTSKNTSLMVVDSMEEIYSSNYSENYSSEEGLRKLVKNLNKCSIKGNFPVLLFDYSTGKANSLLSQTACTIVNADIKEEGVVLKTEKGLQTQKRGVERKVRLRES